MKKLVSLLLCLFLLLPAAAFAEEGWFSSAVLSDEEWHLLCLLNMDEGYGPYEFKAPDGANHLTLTVLEFVDGQWVEFSTFTKELTQPPQQTSVTLTATLQADGTWRTDIQQPRIGTDRPDGRIYIDGYDLPNTITLSISTFGDEYPELVHVFQEEEIDTDGLYCWRRTFRRPTQKGTSDQTAVGTLNEPTLLELYVCPREGASGVPDFSAFNDPTAFAAFDYAFAVTATFTYRPLE